MHSLQFNLSYTADLKNLDAQARTIQTNLDNYQQRLTKLSQKMGHELHLFAYFHKLAQKKYLVQIEHDYAGFKTEAEQLTKLVALVQTSQAIKNSGDIYIGGNVSDSSLNTGSGVKQFTS